MTALNEKKIQTRRKNLVFLCVSTIHVLSLNENGKNGKKDDYFNCFSTKAHILRQKPTIFFGCGIISHPKPIVCGFMTAGSSICSWMVVFTIFFSFPQKILNSFQNVLFPDFLCFFPFLIPEFNQLSKFIQTIF